MGATETPSYAWPGGFPFADFALYARLHQCLDRYQSSLFSLAGMSRPAGSCNTTSTASATACIAGALAVSLPRNAAIPAVDAHRYVFAHLPGIRSADGAGRSSSRSTSKGSVRVTKNCGPCGCGHGRRRQHRPAAQAAAPGHERHGAHFGRAHQRHDLRRGSAARGTRSGGGRPARGGTQRH